jgi:hypothetical protein
LRPHHSAQENIVLIHFLLLTCHLLNKHSPRQSDFVSASDYCSFRDNYLDFFPAVARRRLSHSDTKHRQFLTNDKCMCDALPVRMNPAYVVWHGGCWSGCGCMAASLSQEKPKAAGATPRRSLHAVLPELWNGRSTVVHGCAGKSRGASAKKRTIDGSAGGSIIGALAGGGKGSAIGARVGGGIGAGSDNNQGRPGKSAHGGRRDVRAHGKLSKTGKS